MLAMICLIQDVLATTCARVKPIQNNHRQCFSQCLLYNRTDPSKPTLYQRAVEKLQSDSSAQSFCNMSSNAASETTLLQVADWQQEQSFNPPSAPFLSPI